MPGMTQELWNLQLLSFYLDDEYRDRFIDIVEFQSSNSLSYYVTNESIYQLIAWYGKGFGSQQVYNMAWDLVLFQAAAVYLGVKNVNNCDDGYLTWYHISSR